MARFDKAGSGRRGKAVEAGRVLLWPVNVGRGQAELSTGKVRRVFIWRAKSKNNKEVEKMVYQWKSGSHIKANAQEAGEQFERLAATADGLTPETVLNANREEGTPLHDSFEWDDTAAAEKYRLNQAGHFIRCICNVIESENPDEESEPQRAFYITTEVSKYEPIETIVQSKTKYEKLLEIALSELNAFKRKYDSLVELQPVIKAADTVIKRQYQSNGKRGIANAE